MRCEELRELAPDIALDIADGEQRAAALRHLEGCGECRRLVEELSQLSDELLRVAPTHEPPEGFESRVIERLGLRKPRRRRLARRALQLAGPPIAAAAITAAALVAVYHDDHETASSYRETLDRANGRYFQADTLRDPAGDEAGTAFAYEGSPCWIFVTVDPAHRADVSSAQLVTKDGRSIRLGDFWLDHQFGSWGGAIPVHLDQVAAFRLLGKHPGEVLETPIHEDGQSS